ncbi:hypothetical protein [Neptunitalea lumnitzerae]|uniref:Secreted protein n=1 Tax=Neptunitalea lumnitzerae TaxID=2965509 RepID=A0ABQ5MJS2_9FLAO|nr:hypothetical protein [Neptunitalea sp. Y10]GLB49665.1 hypothetical protein Y10_20330 [Neptunitalea sp. Y10]
MKSVYLSILFLLVCISVSVAQVTDGTKSGNLNIKAEENTTTTTTVAPKVNLSLLPGKQPTTQSNFGEEKKEISMLPQEEFLKNTGDKVVNKVNKSLTEGNVDLSQFKRDQFLGDVRTSAKKLKIVCRDYQYVDGDRIEIALNDTVVNANMLLEGKFKGVVVDLPVGLNRIDFTALNMGSSFPNTAELIIFDDNENVLSSTQWNLYTGFKATIVVVKD